MNLIRPSLAIAIASLSLAAFAQTANTPGGQAATGTQLDQTTKSPQNAPKTTATTPDATNPTGSTTPGHTTGTTGTSPRTANHTAPGDAPTYPAPAKDGTPTK